MKRADRKLVKLMPVQTFRADAGEREVSKRRQRRLARRKRLDS